MVYALNLHQRIYKARRDIIKSKKLLESSQVIIFAFELEEVKLVTIDCFDTVKCLPV
jgi:hypothetical protein